jgi:RES domain-containing protein
VNDLRVIDLRRPAVRAELDVELAELTGARSGAQALTVRALALGAEGIIAPSAAHEGHWNLVVFPSAFAKLRVAGSTATRPKPPA